MDLHLSKLFINTTDKSRYLRFLSCVFDCEDFSQSNDMTYIHVAGIALHLIEASAEVKQLHPSFSFTVNDSLLLDSIAKKIEFYCYRENIELLPIQLTDLSLKFSDPDGNLWLIESL